MGWFPFTCHHGPCCCYYYTPVPQLIYRSSSYYVPHRTTHIWFPTLPQLLRSFITCVWLPYALAVHLIWLLVLVGLPLLRLRLFYFYVRWLVTTRSFHTTFILPARSVPRFIWFFLRVWLRFTLPRSCVLWLDYPALPTPCVGYWFWFIITFAVYVYSSHSYRITRWFTHWLCGYLYAYRYGSHALCHIACACCCYLFTRTYLPLRSFACLPPFCGSRCCPCYHLVPACLYRVWFYRPLYLPHHYLALRSSPYYTTRSAVLPAVICAFTILALRLPYAFTLLTVLYFWFLPLQFISVRSPLPDFIPALLAVPFWLLVQLILFPFAFVHTTHYYLPTYCIPTVIFVHNLLFIVPFLVGSVTTSSLPAVYVHYLVGLVQFSLLPYGLVPFVRFLLVVHLARGWLVPRFFAFGYCRLFPTPHWFPFTALLRSVIYIPFYYLLRLVRYCAYAVCWFACHPLPFGSFTTFVGSSCWFWFIAVGSRSVPFSLVRFITVLTGSPFPFALLRCTFGGVYHCVRYVLYFIYYLIILRLLFTFFYVGLLLRYSFFQFPAVLAFDSLRTRFTARVLLTLVLLYYLYFACCVAFGSFVTHTRTWVLVSQFCCCPTHLYPTFTLRLLPPPAFALPVLVALVCLPYLVHYPYWFVTLR